MKSHDPQERFIQAGEVRLCYESFGSVEAPTVLIIVGLGAQLVAVSDEFCRELVDQGFRVIRFDNRDVGRSSILSEVQSPTLLQLLRRNPRYMPYTLEDMAGDAVALLDGLGVASVHLVGFSMGGMIAQTVASKWPERVDSLASVMSSTGSLLKGWPSWRFLKDAVKPTPAIEDKAIVRRVAMAYARGAGGLPDDPMEIWRIARLSHERNPDRSGVRRQLGAMVSARDRTVELSKISAPTIVIHGKADGYVHPSGGRATAAAIPNSKLYLIEDLAHNLPPEVRPYVVNLIAANANREL